MTEKGSSTRGQVFTYYQDGGNRAQIKGGAIQNWLQIKHQWQAGDSDFFTGKKNY